MLLPSLSEGAMAISQDGGATHIAQLLFSTYLVPFELASILLLLAMVGAVILSKRVFPEEEGEAPLEAEKSLSLPGNVCMPLEQEWRDALAQRSVELNAAEPEPSGVR
jgi:hypothetical protein